MLFQLFVGLPSFVLAEIAWCVRVGIALICLIVLFAVAILAVSFVHKGARVHAVPLSSQPAFEPSGKKFRKRCPRGWIP